MLRVEIQDEIKGAPRFSVSIREAIEEAYEGTGRSYVDELEVRVYRHDYDIDELENVPMSRNYHIIYRKLAR